MRDGGTHTIGVGVGCNKQIWFYFVSKRKAQIPRFTKFGVGIGAGWKMTIGIFLLGHNGNVVNTKLMQNARNTLKTGAV